ncbi:MAG: hypothetical protein ABI297_08770 [Ginsengibacter sp.]
MESIKQTLFADWNFMRWLRLGLGIIVGIQAFEMHDPLLGFLSAFLLFQSVTNTGCCGGARCAIPKTKNDLNKKGN